MESISLYGQVRGEAAIAEPVEALIKQARQGDREAFGRLVRPYLRPAMGAATIITGSEADGADAVQDALLAAWRGLPGLREPSMFAAWFRRIVIRAAVRVSRRRRHVAELDPSAAGPADELDRALDLRTLRKALARLDHADRVLLTLHDFWALPVAETARLLRIPEGTVKSRVHHALRRLRAAYEAEERR